MKFHLRVYDNYHYNDESEAYDSGQFDSYDAAVNAAKSIVDRFLIFNWTPGMKPEDLNVLFSLYGDDPIVLPDDHANQPSFSARDYVSENVIEICKRLENNENK